MRLARVVGTVVATVKDDGLEGKKLLLLCSLRRDGSLFGDRFLALDSVGAGVGEDVWYVRSKEASFAWHPREVPTDCTVVGILDPVHFKGKQGPSVDPSPKG